MMQYDGSFAIPPGVVLQYAGLSAPDGWLLCDGSAISRTVYAGLFAAIDTAWGIGDGSTTFNLPDLRGRVWAGNDNMGGSSADRVTDASADSIGGNMGTETHTLTETEMPSHHHTSNKVLDGSPLGSTDNNYDVICESGASRSDVQTSSVGGGNAHNNMQPTIFGLYIIKT
jgi:microcystin-dependent protein